MADGDAVYVSADNTVRRAATANASAVIGVADEAIASGNTGRILVYGRKTMTADGAVAVGDPVSPAGTAGRVVSLTTHNHTFTGNAMATHSHTFTGDAMGTHSHTFTGDAMGTHRHTGDSHVHLIGSPTTGSVASSTHTHTIPNPGGPTGTYTHDLVDVHTGRYCSSTSGGPTDCSFRAITSFHSCTVADKDHWHVFTDPTGAPSATTTVVTGIPAGTGAGGGGYTSYNSAGTPSGTIDSVSAGTPSGTIDSVSAGTPSGTIGSVGNARILGKALTAAAGAGDTLDVLVCLAG